jgi:hypothetical protein
MAVILVFLQAAVGLLFASLTLLGFPLIALWTWRALSGVLTVVCLIILAQLIVRERTSRRFTATADPSAYRRSNSPVDGFLILGTTALTIAVFVCAVAATAPQRGAAMSAPAPTPTPGAVAHSTADSLVRIDFWHAAGLTVLGCGAILFGLLFIAAMQQQGLLWFESNSGSLGGATGGWRMSASMGYLGATILFAVMFGALIVHDENLFRTPAPSDGVSPPAASVQNQPSSPPAKIDSTNKGESSVQPPSGSDTKQP